MNGLDFLNLVIGLIFIYLIYSIAASTIWEIIITFSNMRGRMLSKWFCDNFEKLTFRDDEKKGKLKSKIIEHPLVKGMLRRYDKIPSYISSGVFTDVLFDLIANEDTENEVSDDKVLDIKVLRESLEETKSLSPGVKRVFLQYVNEASGNLQEVKEKIGKWFDETQERLMGSYKKSLQLWIFVIATILVGATNADTISLASYLYRNPDAREAIANKADLYVRDSAVIASITRIDTTLIDSTARMEYKQISEKLDKDLKRLKDFNDELNEAGLPLGWNSEKIKTSKTVDYIKKIGGLLLTIFAVSMGAPFWFDILSKLAILRSSGNKPKTILEEKEIAAGSQKPGK